MLRCIWESLHVYEEDLRLHVAVEEASCVDIVHRLCNLCVYILVQIFDILVQV